MENVKPCPFCGEQILAVAVKCKHCGSAIGSSPSVTRKRAKLPSWVVTTAVVIAVLIGATYLTNWNQTRTLSGSGFSNADISQAESSIRAQYEKQHDTVLDVQMIRESPTRLSGFVKLKMPAIPYLGAVVSKTCTATMGEDRKYIWQCA